MSVRRRHGAKTRTHAWDAESVWRVIEDATRHEEISGTLPRYLARQLIKRVKETIAENIRLRQLLERGEPSQGEGQPYAWLPGHAGGECHLCKGSIYDGKHVIGIPGRVKCPKERQERPEPGGGK